ncbi:MAG TPA: AraC family transcriptional regulator [Candidatus Baltobacteraceae bacterium]|nr:AraC family transcriptional regulator [Candidatus Baltobacteraceae bacterium]
MYPKFAAGYFTGETSQWETADVVLSEVTHASGKAVPMHQHEAPYLSLLLDGAYRERGADFDIRYEPYTLVFHAAGTVHEDEMLGPCRFFAVNFLPRWERIIDELGGSPSHVFELHGGDPIWLALRLYREFLARGDSSEASVEALVYELCAYLAAHKIDDSHEPPWLAEIDRTIRERFHEPLDIAAIAAAAGVHPSHVCRVYRRFRGQTITDTLFGARVQHVARRLTESDEPLSVIAAEAGFADQSHMTRIFKRVTGYPPGKHRRYVQ